MDGAGVTGPAGQIRGGLADRVLRVLGPTWRAAPVRRFAQVLSLALFLYSFFYVSWPYARVFTGQVLIEKEWLPVEAFLWLDPLAGLSTAIAARAWNVALAGGAVVLVFSLFLPRGFCGYLCPLGTLLDAFDAIVAGIGRRSGRADRASRIAPDSTWRRTRYGLLVVVLVAAVFGVLLSGFVAAIPVLTRGLLFTGGRLELGVLKNWGMVSPADVALWVSVVLVAGVFLLGLAAPRFWCRHLCPSGALVSLFGWAGLYRREVVASCTRCGQCVKVCPFDAIEPDFTTRMLDCSSCRTCAGACPVGAIRFVRRATVSSAEEKADRVFDGPLSRRAFLASSAGGAAVAVAVRVVPTAGPQMLRPPGSVAEERFLDLCVRCGQCVQVCPGPVLRLSGLEGGFESLWTPVAVPTHAGCHQDCNACTQVCPTGAILPLSIEEKRKTPMGLAVIDTRACLPHKGDRDCQLCFDECNAAGYRAIEMRAIQLPMGQVPDGTFSPDEIEAMGQIRAPFLVKDACVGCGLCEYRCHSVNVKQQGLLNQSAVVVVPYRQEAKSGTERQE